MNPAGTTTRNAHQLHLDARRHRAIAIARLAAVLVAKLAALRPAARPARPLSLTFARWG
jgi:hypothetical protein